MRNRILVLSILAVVSVACTGKKESKSSKAPATKEQISKEKELAAYRAKKRVEAEAASTTKKADKATVVKPQAALAEELVVNPNSPKKVFRVLVTTDGKVSALPSTQPGNSVVRPSSGSSSNVEITSRSADPFSDFNNIVGRYQVGQKLSDKSTTDVISADGFEVEISSDYTLRVSVKKTDCEANIVFKVVRADGQYLSLNLQAYDPLVQNANGCEPIKIFLPIGTSDKDLRYSRPFSNALFLQFEGGYIPLVSR